MRFVNGQMQLRRMLAVLNSSSPVLADDRATCKVYSGPWDPPLPLISPDDDVIIDSLSFSCCDDGLYRCEARGRYASNISDVYEFVAEFRVGGGTIFSQPVRREFAGYHTIEIVIAGNSEFIKNHYPQINGYRFTLRDV
jgi:hypothetical protein